MSIKRSLVTALMLACAVPLANAVEYRTGYLPPTAAEQAWADANKIRVTSVLPNRLALQRVAAEQQIRQGFAAPITAMAAEDGAEIIGVKGAAAASATKSLTDPVVMAYPRSVDNSAEAWFPVIGSQGGQGSCAAFSTTYYTMTSQVARLRGWNVKSDNNPAHIFSPRFIYNMINSGVDRGSHPGFAYRQMIQMGCATYADFPYDAVDYKSWPTTASVWRDAINYRMASFGTVAAIDTDAGLANAKQMLADGYIFNFIAAIFDWRNGSFANDPATTADDVFFAPGLPNSRRLVVTHCTSGPVNHAMTVVGYNDDVWSDLNGNGVVDAGEKGALRVANSWGAGWEPSDAGFIWVSYDALKTVSAVTGGFSGTTRREAIWGHSLDWLSARSAYAPSLVAEVTVTHAQRNQVSLAVGRGPVTATTPLYTGGPHGLSGGGASWAFDGTTTAVAATFVIDCTDLMSTGSGDRWFASFNDSAASLAGTFTKVRFISGSNTVTEATVTNPSGGLPKSVDNATVYAYADLGLPTNTAPVAQGKNVSTVVNTLINSIALVATDVNGDSLIYSVVTGPSHGQLTGSGASRTYQPNANYQGSDSFTFKANDGKADSNIATISISVTNAPPTVATAAAATPSPVTGTTTALSVLGADNGGEANLTYSWATTGTPPAPVTFSANNSYAAKNSTATFAKAGSYAFQCTIKDAGNLTATSTVTVTVNQTAAASLAVKPGMASVNFIKTQQYEALVQDQFGGALATQPTFTWSLSATTSGAISSTGLFTANTTAGGPYTVTATGGGKSGTAAVTVMAVNIPVGPPGYTWCADEGGGFALSGASDVAFGINGQFKFLFHQTGTAIFNSGNFGGDPAPGVVKCGFYKLSSSTNSAPGVAAAAAAASSPVTGTTTALSVLGADDAGEAGLTYAWATTGAPPAGVTFSVNNSNAAKASTATFTKAGSYTFQCTIKDSGNLTATSSVTVTVNQTASSVAVTPASATVAFSATQPFTASLKDQFSAALAVQPTATWSLSATTSGTLSSTGLFTANTTTGGPYTVTATSGGKTSTANVTVTAAGSGGGASASGGGGGGGGCGLGSGLAGLMGLTMAMMAFMRLRNRLR